jgi:hypothetical protein
MRLIVLRLLNLFPPGRLCNLVSKHPNPQSDKVTINLLPKEIAV